MKKLEYNFKGFIFTEANLVIFEEKQTGFFLVLN